MLNFTYLARDQAGSITRGAMAAESAAGLKHALQSAGLQLLSLEARAEPSSVWSWYERHIDPLLSLPPRSRDVEIALRQLAMMLRSGLDLIAALQTLSDQCSSRGLARILVKIQTAVNQGDALATAMARYRAFPAIAVQLVMVGEQTGTLSDVLDQAATHLAHRRASVADVRTALAYPAVVATAALCIALYLIFAVIPELQKFLSAMGRRLPHMTQTLVDLAQWGQLNGIGTLVTAVFAIIAFVVTLQWPPARLVMDRLLLRIPMVGSILRLAGTATLANSLAVMIRSGIQLVEALAIAQRLQPNRYLAARVEAARDAVVRGEGLAPALATRHAYMPMLASMVAVAERTGQMDAILDDVAKFCEVELQTKMKRLSRLAEPAVIVVAGGIVGYVYMAFFMALMSAGGSVR